MLNSWENNKNTLVIWLELLIFASLKAFIMIEQNNANANAKQLTLHIGQLIKEELERQERTVSWFARKLYCDRSNVYKIFKRPTIDTELLLRISVILNHDFFGYYMAKVAENATSKEVVGVIGNKSVDFEAT